MTEAVANMPALLVDHTPKASGAPVSGEMLKLPPIATPSAETAAPTPISKDMEKNERRFLPSMQHNYSSSPYRTGDRSPWNEGD